MRRRHVETKVCNQTRQARRLSPGQVEDEPRESSGVDDRMLERALQAPPDQPCVEGVVAVLDKDCAVRKAEERAPRVLELRGADQHRAVDVVAPSRIGVDRCAAVDQRVEEGQRAVEGEALGAYLKYEKRSIARGLDVEGHELRFVQRRLAADIGGVDGDLLPRHELGRAARLQIKRTRRAHRASTSARRAHAISSPLSTRSSSTATT